MLEASEFSASAKAKLNASRYTRALYQVELIEQELSDQLIAKKALSPKRLAELLEAIQTAMSSSPDGEIWTEMWALYSRWQAHVPEVMRTPGHEERVVLQQRITAKIRDVPSEDRSVCRSALLTSIDHHGAREPARTALAALCAAAHDDVIWHALCEVRQVITMERAEE